MTILSADIQLIASQVMDDVPEGGGQPTAQVIADGSTGIFNDISEVDRAGGRVNLRKLFPSVRTANTDGYFGANMIVSEVPADPKVSVTLFTTADTFDRRSDAKSRVESYLALGASYPGYLFGNHISGQSIVSLLQSPDLPLPVMGDTFALRAHEIPGPVDEQYAKVLRVSSRLREFEDDHGKFTRVEVILQLTDALAFNFKGYEASRSGPSNVELTSGTKIYSTVVADASRYYGATTLTKPAAVGDLAINVSSIFTQLVPSTRIEVPVTDARPNQRSTALIKAGDNYAFNVNAVFTANQALYIGGQILPGTFSISAGAIKLTDAAGILYNGANAVGTIDYANGILKLGSSVFGAGAAVFRGGYTPAAGPVNVSSTAGIPVTVQNQRLSWTFSADSLPARGSVQVSYRSFGNWYMLTDDSAGALRGTDTKFGAGAVNYATGSITVTLGAMPDVGSQIIIAWVDTASTTTLTKSPVPGAALTKAFGIVLTLNKAITPGTVQLTWNDGTARSAVDAGGLLAGDATGDINYATGKITFRPNLLPPANTQVALTISTGEAKAAEVLAFTAQGSNVAFNVGGNVKARSFDMVVFADYGQSTISGLNGYLGLTGELLHVLDDGAGNLVIANGTDMLKVGTINYGSGACTLAKVTDGYVIQVQNYGVREVSPGVSAVMPIGNASVKTTLTLSGFKLPASMTVPFWDVPFSGSAVAACRYVGVSGDAQQSNFVVDALFAALPLAPSAFSIGTCRHYALTDNSYVRDVNPASGTAVAAGRVGIVGGYYGVILSKWDAGAQNLISAMCGVNAPGTSATVSNISFRTAISQLYSGGFTVSGSFTDGTTFNVTADQDGIIKNDALGIYGRVDYVTGLATAYFGSKTVDTDAGQPGVVDVSFLGIANLKYIKTGAVLADTLRYNCVGSSYLPLDQNILGMNPVRLPSDGRVPIFRLGSFIVIGNTKKTDQLNVNNNQTINLNRIRLSRVRVLGADGNVINSGYTVDLETGKVTFTDVANYVQPIRIEDRIEDMVLLSDVQIGGQLTFTRQLTHDYPVAGTTVSSALVIGDMHARVPVIFDQETQNKVWSDTLNGNPATGKFNAALAPITVTNKGALTERWALVFQSSTTFNVVGEHVGVIANGTINADCAPINPAAGTPYFTVPAMGWGNGWSAGNVLRFNTVSAAYPVWIIRTIQQGAATVDKDSFTLLVRGDVTKN